MKSVQVIKDDRVTSFQYETSLLKYIFYFHSKNIHLL